MVLYHAYHLGNVVRAIIHRLTENKREKAILLIGNPNILGDLHEKMYELEMLGIFDKIIRCNECIGFLETEEKKCEEIIYNHFENIFKENNIELDRIKKVYTSVDTLHSFGVYLAMKMKAYYFYELPKNFFPTAQNRVNNLPSEMKVYAKVMTKYGASDGSYTLCKRIISSLSSPLEDAIVFDFDNKCYEISKKHREILLRFFDAPISGLNNESATLLVTSSQWLIRDLPNVKKQAGLLYQLLIDFFITDKNNKLIIKPHPLSRIGKEECEKYFDNALILNPHFPSNFIKLIDGVNISQILATTSSGVQGICENAEKKTLIVGEPYYRMFYIIKKVYVSYQIAYNVLNNIDEISHYGISNQFIENVLKFCSPFKNRNTKWFNVDELKENSIIIIDNIEWNPGNYKERLINTLDSTSNNSIIFFINSKEDFCFYAEELNEYIIPIVIQKKKHKSLILEDMKSEVLYVFCKNDTIRTKIKQFNMNKILEQTGIELIVNPTNDKDIAKHIDNLESKVKENKYIEKINSMDKKIFNLEKTINDIINHLRKI